MISTSQSWGISTFRIFIREMLSRGSHCFHGRAAKSLHCFPGIDVTLPGSWFRGKIWPDFGKMYFLTKNTHWNYFFAIFFLTEPFLSLFCNWKPLLQPFFKILHTTPLKCDPQLINESSLPIVGLASPNMILRNVWLLPIFFCKPLPNDMNCGQDLNNSVRLTFYRDMTW